MPANRESLPVRHTEDLRIGRRSIPGARYFLTLCEVKRRPGFTVPRIAEALRAAVEECHASGDFTLRAATVMPDHIHLLGTLGSRLSLHRVVGKFKARTRDTLRQRALEWQDNFYDHRLDPDDDAEPYALYLFLNPYRAGLLNSDQPWTHRWRWGEVRFRFETMLTEGGGAQPEWLDRPAPEGARDF